MRQRLAIARGLLHRPRLIFLDEPTRSLDPLAASRVHELLRELVADGVTVFLTTHHMAEAEALCQRIAVMHRGKIRACARPDVLQQMLTPSEHYRLELDRYDAQLTPKLATLASRWQVEAAPGGRQWLKLELEPGNGALTAVLDSLRTASIEIVSIQSRSPTLEKVFAQLVEEQD
jgi:ABC-2 type transport system ATP-binding protein